MDDNKLLTLPNSERIRLTTYCKLIIEVFDLQYASPATISRCGMTYMDPKNLGFRPYYVRWVKQRCDARGRGTEAGFLRALYEAYVPKLVAYVLEGDTGKRDKDTGLTPADAIEEPLALALPTASHLNMVKQLCALLENPRDVEPYLPSLLEPLALDPVRMLTLALAPASVLRLPPVRALLVRVLTLLAPVPTVALVPYPCLRPSPLPCRICSARPPAHAAAQPRGRRVAPLCSPRRGAPRPPSSGPRWQSRRESGR
jgi:hypothetical protein